MMNYSPHDFIPVSRQPWAVIDRSRSFSKPELFSIYQSNMDPSNSTVFADEPNPWRPSLESSTYPNGYNLKSKSLPPGSSPRARYPLPEEYISLNNAANSNAWSPSAHLSSNIKHHSAPGTPSANGNNNIEDELTAQNLYKTELCRSFEETGNCRYGIKCQFAHGRAELRPVIRHPKYKTEVCKTFHTIGTCPYGKRCRFIHNTSEASSSHTNNTTTNTNNENGQQLRDENSKPEVNNMQRNGFSPVHPASNNPIKNVDPRLFKTSFDAMTRSMEELNLSTTPTTPPTTTTNGIHRPNSTNIQEWSTSWTTKQHPPRNPVSPSLNNLQHPAPATSTYNPRIPETRAVTRLKIGYPPSPAEMTNPSPTSPRMDQYQQPQQHTSNSQLPMNCAGELASNFSNIPLLSLPSSPILINSPAPAPASAPSTPSSSAIDKEISRLAIFQKICSD